MTLEQAVEYLTDRTGLPNPDGAAAVAEALGCLPLGLAQAAAVIGPTRRYPTYSTYLTALASRPLREVLPAGLGYPRRLPEAVLLSVQATNDTQPATRPLLDLLAVLDPAGVSRPIVTVLVSSGHDHRLRAGLRRRWRSGGVDVDADQLIGVLAGASLVTVTANGTAVVMHQLVARTLREAASTAKLGKILAEAAGAVRQAVPAEQAPPPAPEFVAELARHTLALLGRADTPDLKTSVPVAVARMAMVVGAWLHRVGAYTSMIAVDDATLAVQQRVLGPEHRDTLTSRSNVAAGYREVGRYDEAITLDEQTLATRQRVLGPNHPDTCASRNNLANDYRAVGRYDEAITRDQQNLIIRQRVLGPEHPSTLNSRSGLALGYRDVGRGDEAIALDEETLTIRQRVLGPDHPSTLSSRSNLALGYRAVGRYDEAIALNEQTLAIEQRVLGSDHPSTLGSRNNLANDYRAVGRYDEAIALDEQTLVALQRVLGPDHPHTRRSRKNLADGYRALGRYDEANRLQPLANDSQPPTGV
jgi:tetratricopeptide (TPR) repeat protein